MSKFVICKPLNKSVLRYFLELDGEQFFLFDEEYRTSNKAFFSCGVNVSNAINFGKTTSYATRNTMEKIRKALSRLEKVEGISVWNKTERKSGKNWNKPNKSFRIYQDRMNSSEVA